MFQLIWQELALDELAECYVAATVDERERMARAIDALNTRLRANPLGEGESRTGIVRVVGVKRYGH